MTLKIAYQKTTSWKPTLELCDMPLWVAYKQSFLPSPLIVYNKRKNVFLKYVYTFHYHPDKTLSISKRNPAKTHNNQLGDRAKAQGVEGFFSHEKKHTIFFVYSQVPWQHRFGLNDFESAGLGARDWWWGPYFVPASTSRCPFFRVSDGLAIPFKVTTLGDSSFGSCQVFFVTKKTQNKVEKSPKKTHCFRTIVSVFKNRFLHQKKTN